MDLENELERHGCRPGNLKLIVSTHGDFDHTGNAAYLAHKFDTRTLMHSADAPMVEQGDMFVDRDKVNPLMRKLVAWMTGFGKKEHFSPDIQVESGYDFSPHGFKARVVHLPGHSKGSIGVLTAAGELFSGDLVENTRKPALSTLLDEAAVARASLEVLKASGAHTIYPGHGEPFPMHFLDD